MSRTLKEKEKAQQEKFQSILSSLLKDEDNKYCVDCDAKGPRWASWNLGIFLCIRCAGIHRNLGVHISRVKSVNLDSWTAEQVESVQDMGNSKARAVYEANLPDNYRRPQTDSSLEAFIRDKYEKKRYIAREWIPPQPKSGSSLLSSSSYNDEKKEKKKTKPKSATSSTMQLSGTSRPKGSGNVESIKSQKTVNVPAKKQEPKASADLLGLEINEQQPAPQAANGSDPFGDFLSASGNASTGQVQNDINSISPSKHAEKGEDENIFVEQPDKKNTKESILALYGSGGGQQQQQPQQQMYRVPVAYAKFGIGGMYMPPQQQQAQMNYGMNMGPQMQNGMMGGQNMGLGGYPNTSQAMPPNNMQQQHMMMGQNNMMAQNSMAVGQNNMAGMGQYNMAAMGQNNMAAMGQNNMPAMGQNNMAAIGQNNAMGQNQMGAMGQNNMMGMGPNNMAAMGQNNMINSMGMMPQQGQMGMYNMAQQQGHGQNLQQVQQQLASIKIGGGSMPSQGNAGWGGQPVGHTLSNNLWQ